MAQALRPLALNSGNVVSVGLKLYRSQLKVYSKIALISTLWYMLPLLLLGVSTAIAIFIQASVANNGANQATFIGVYSLIALSSVGFGILCWARAMFNLSLISRLAFMELTQQAESIQYARQRLKPKLWSIFVVHILTFFVLSAIQTTVAIVITPVLTAISFIAIAVPWIGVFVLIVGQFIPLLAYLVGYACFFIPEVPIAVESHTNPGQSVARSGQLSFRSFVHVMLVIGILAVISLPFYGLALTLPTILLTIISNQMVGFDPGVAAPPMYRELLLVIGLGALLFLLVNLVVMPLWQTVKAVLYYDLRSRHEGFDLSLRETIQPTAS